MRELSVLPQNPARPAVCVYNMHKNILKGRLTRTAGWATLGKGDTLCGTSCAAKPYSHKNFSSAVIFEKFFHTIQCLLNVGHGIRIGYAGKAFSAVAESGAGNDSYFSFV